MVHWNERLIATRLALLSPWLDSGRVAFGTIFGDVLVLELVDRILRFNNENTVRELVDRDHRKHQKCALRKVVAEGQYSDYLGPGFGVPDFLRLNRLTLNGMVPRFELPAFHRHCLSDHDAGCWTWTRNMLVAKGIGLWSTETIAA